MQRVKQTEQSITEGAIWKQLLWFFFPILLGTFFQQLYNTIDAIIVGQFVGKEALAAVGGATGTFINLLVGFFVGLSSGATVIISQYYGGNHEEETSQAVHTAIALGLVSGVILMVIGLIVSPLALRAMGTPEDIMKPATTYIQVYFAGIIFTLIYNIGSSILRAVGDAKRPLYYLIVCCFANLILDLLFVIVFDMGVLGVAIATLLAQAISAVLVLLALIRTSECYRLYIKKIRLTGWLLRDIIRIGLPAGLQSVMYSVSNVLIQSSVNTFGTNTIAAWTAYGKIDALFWMIMGAFGVSATTFSGQNFGAQKYDRIRKSVRICLIGAAAVSVLLSTFLYFFGPYIYLLFTDDPAVIEQGMEILKIFCPFFITYICVEILSGAIRGTGDSFIPMILTALGICGLRIVWILLVVPAFPTIQTVALSYPVTWMVTSALFIVYYLHGGWLRRRIIQLGLQPENK